MAVLKKTSPLPAVVSMDLATRGQKPYRLQSLLFARQTFLPLTSRLARQTESQSVCSRVSQMQNQAQPTRRCLTFSLRLQCWPFQWTPAVDQSAKVHVRIPRIAVKPPVPPVKPTKAAFPPTMLGMLIAWLVVNVFAAFVVSVIVIVKVVPSYVMCTLKTFPLCRSTPELVMSTAGVVGETP